MRLIALQLVNLAAHHKYALLGIQGRIVRHPDIRFRHIIELRLDLLQMRRNRGIALLELGHFQLALLNHQANFLQLAP